MGLIVRCSPGEVGLIYPALLISRLTAYKPSRTWERVSPNILYDGSTYNTRTLIGQVG